MISLNMFDLNLLRVFDAVMRERSVQSAADRLGLSPPAVSNALGRLRSALDDPLFVRTRHGMEPTPFAQTLNEPVQNALFHIRAALACNVEFEPLAAVRSFSILMTDFGTATFIPRLIKRLAKVAPHVNLSILHIDHADYEDALDSAAADLAIGRVRLSQSFHSELVITSEEVAVMRRGHPAIRRKADGTQFITLEDYLAAPHINVATRGATKNSPEKGLAGFQKRRIAVTIPHVTALGYILPDTDLVATIPKLCMSLFGSGGELDWAALPFSMDPDLIYMWWHNRGNDDPGLCWLRDVVRQGLLEIGDMPGADASSTPHP